MKMAAAELPVSGRLAGVDYGTVRIGLAVSDPSQQWVTPATTYVRRNSTLDASFFNEFASHEQLVGWVIGLPIHCDGNESQKSGEARSFAAWLAGVSDLPFVFYDERFSTREARQLLQETGFSSAKKKKKLDQLAAHVILSHFLDGRAAMSQNNALER